MPGIVAGCAAAAIATAATVAVASLPDAQALLLPFSDGGNEYLVPAFSVLASLPILAIMAVVGASGRE